jgi:hypothetical protein
MALWTQARNILLRILLPISEIYAQHGSMYISTKYFIAHSHAWATGHICAVLI